jgi:hypothetical protein
MSAEGDLERTREDLRELVRADPDLAPAERETTITVAVDEARARIHTEEAAIIRRLLCHDGVTVDALGVHDGDRRRTIDLDDALAEVEQGDIVSRLKGSIPLRYVSIGTVGRDHDKHSPVVSHGVLED